MIHKLFKPCIYVIFALISFAYACVGVDRSEEQPFSPTVKTVEITVDADSCRMLGAIVASPNSSILARGFYYGNDTLKVRVLSNDSTQTFVVKVDSLEVGEYYGVAFARNGIGESLGDTIFYSIVK